MKYFTDFLLADFKTPPYKHQAAEFEAAVGEKSRALLWQMRTGKSKMMVDTACHLYKAGKIDCVLVFAPNGVHENWVLREIPTHSWDSVDWEAFAWLTTDVGRLKKSPTKAEKERSAAWWSALGAALKRPDLLWLTVNSESVIRPDVRKLVANVVKKRRVLVIWDEASDFRTPGSKRTLMMRALAARVEKAGGYLRILDGTLSTNSPLHVFAPFELLGKGALGFDTADAFKDHYAIYETGRGAGGRQFQKLAAYKNLEDLKARMAPLSSVVLRSDCEDLPDIIEREEVFDLTDEQLEVYGQVEKRIAAQLGDEEVPIGKQTMLLNKLQQVTSGFLLDEFKEAHRIPGRNPRMERLLYLVRRMPGKVIVWCQFQHEIDEVVAALKAEGHKVLEYHGRVNKERKAYARVAFQEDQSYKAIVGQAQAGGRGLDFSAADHMIWYSHTFNAITREQAKERATKMAGSNIEMVDLIASTGPDRYIRDTVEGKINVADDVAGRGLQTILQRLRKE